MRCRAKRCRHCTRVPDDPSEATSVDSGDTGHALLEEHRTEIGLRSKVAVSTSEVSHDDASAERTDRLKVGGVDAVVADVGICEGDDLPRVARVGDHFLVAG